MVENLLKTAISGWFCRKKWTLFFCEKFVVAHKSELQFKSELNTTKTQGVIHKTNLEIFSIGNAYLWANRTLTMDITHSIFELSRQIKYLRIRLDELYDIMTAAHASYGAKSIKNSHFRSIVTKKMNTFFSLKICCNSQEWATVQIWAQYDQNSVSYSQNQLRNF